MLTISLLLKLLPPALQIISNGNMEYGYDPKIIIQEQYENNISEWILIGST